VARSITVGTVGLIRGSPQFRLQPFVATFMATSQRRANLPVMELDEILKPDDSQLPPPADWDDALEM